MAGNLTGNRSLPLPDDMVFNEGHRVQIIGYSVLMTISSVENLVVLILLCLRRPMSRMNRLLISLTVSDLLVTFITMPMEIAWSWTVQWLANDAVCKLMMVGRIFGLYSSSFNLVAISIDRFCIIMYPFTNMTTADLRVRCSLIIVWTLSALCSLPQAFVFRKLYHPDHPTFAQCLTFGAFSTKQLEATYNVFVTLMIFIIPLMLFCLFYGRLWCFIRQRHIMTSATPAATSSTASSRNDVPPPAYDVIAASALLRTTSHHHDAARHSSGKRTAWHVDKHHTRDCTTNGTADFSLGQSMRYSKAPNIYMRAKSKSFKMAVTLVIVFLVCWVPYYLVSCLFWFDPEFFQHIHTSVQRGLFIFAVSQSCLNPIVTGIFCLRLDKKLAGLACWRSALGRLVRTPEDRLCRDNNHVPGNHGALATPASGLFTHTSANRSVRAQRRDQFV